jgi:exodeoxyribonuclease-3
VKIATYNAASIRARLPLIVEWMAEHEPDVLAVQETKVEDSKFPMEAFEELGYHVAIHGQKAWNGVATLSKSLPTNVKNGFMDELFPTDARILTCEVDGIPIINTYVPNGNTVGSDKFLYKLRWLERFRRFLDENFKASDPLVWLGDINIAPKPEDVYDSKKLYGSVGHHPDEFSRLGQILEFGLVDTFRQLHPGDGYFTYWDFVIPNSVKRNVGWRIDHIYTTEPLALLLKSCTIDVGARLLDRPSDHTFVTAEFDLNP